MQPNINITSAVIVMVIISMILLILFNLTSCAWFGPKTYNTSDFIEYDGDLSGNYRSSDDMVRIYGETLACAQITVPIPPPGLRVMGCEQFEDCDVDGVMCDGKPMAGCYEPSTNKIILPANTTADVIEYQYIKHFLNHVPDLLGSDAATQEIHKSELFDKCAGSIKLLD